MSWKTKPMIKENETGGLGDPNRRFHIAEVCVISRRKREVDSR